MSTSIFDNILYESEEQLLHRFYNFKSDNALSSINISDIGIRFKLHKEQLICALGFNPDARFLIELLPILGFTTFNELNQERNSAFISDIYKRISLDNIIKIYERIKDNQKTLDVMQYLLRDRLLKIEREIDSTVNSMIIEKYKTEMRTIYNLGIASMDFTEERLDKRDSGFRALLNEVTMIVESKLIPIGEIFFRDSILPQEKQKLLNKGLIPKELIQSRINDPGINSQEKKILNDYLKLNRD
ncbi:MAG: hypothetical protein ACI9XC_002083 [Gammaproteobacteria bacterium]|jgi:hypothetical protein